MKVQVCMCQRCKWWYVDKFDGRFLWQNPISNQLHEKLGHQITPVTCDDCHKKENNWRMPLS